MAMLDPYSPIIHKLTFEEMKNICLIDSKNKLYGFLSLKEQNKIIVKKIYIDEIFYVCSSNSGDLIDKLCSISFNITKKRLFGFISEEVEIKFNKPIFCGSYYSTYNPTDKISLKDIYFNEEEAYKNYNGLYDKLFEKGNI